MKTPQEMITLRNTSSLALACSRDHSKMQRKDKDEQNLMGGVHPRRINQVDSLNAEAHNSASW